MYVLPPQRDNFICYSYSYPFVSQQYSLNNETFIPYKRKRPLAASMMYKAKKNM